MERNMLLSTRLVLSFVFACISFTLIVWSHGLSFLAVMENYVRAGYQFILGNDPYQIFHDLGAHNQFKYSPLFAMMMGGLGSFRPYRLLSFWMILNSFIFWFGVFSWFDFYRRTGKLWMILFLACFCELDTSVRVYQVNAMIVGFTLISLSLYRNGNFFWGGVLLALSASLKVFPIIFLIPLLFHGKKSFSIGVVLTFALAFLLPSFVVGLSANVQLHERWFGILIHDSFGIGILDIQSGLERMGLLTAGQFLKWMIVLLSGYFFILSSLSLNESTWASWFVFGTTSFLLVSPRTEVQTYVFLAPSYLLLYPHLKNHRKLFYLLVFAVVIISIRSNFFNDPFGYAVSENGFQVLRIVGALILWGLALHLILKSLKPSRTHWFSIVLLNVFKNVYYRLVPSRNEH